MRSVRLTAVFLVAILLLALPNVTFAGKNDLVNMNVVNGNVRDVLMSLGKIGHASLIIDEKVQGKITVNLKYVPFEDALEIIAQVKGLSYDRVGNVIVVMDRGAEKGDKAGSKSPLGQVHIIKLKHVKAEDVIDKIALQFNDTLVQNGTNKGVTQDQSSKVSSSANQGSMLVSKLVRTVPMPEYERIKIDTISNSLVFKCSDREFEKARTLVDELDKEYPEVLIEAKIVSISKTGQERLGIDWSWSGLDVKPGQFMVDNGATKSIRFGHNDSHSVSSRMILNALITNQEAKLLAKPQVMTINGQPAFIHVGDSLPLIEQNTDNNGKITVTQKGYLDTGIILTYIPTINQDGSITSSIKTEVSIATNETPALPWPIYKVNRKRAETEVRMRDGETIIIGGLINKQEVTTLYKVPLLSDLPILGKLLFTNMETQSEDSEVVIFLTPRIVNSKDKVISTSPNKAAETATSKKSTELLGGEIID